MKSVEEKKGRSISHIFLLVEWCSKQKPANWRKSSGKIRSSERKNLWRWEKLTTFSLSGGVSKDPKGNLIQKFSIFYQKQGQEVQRGNIFIIDHESDEMIFLCKIFQYIERDSVIVKRSEIFKLYLNCIIVNFMKIFDTISKRADRRLPWWWWAVSSTVLFPPHIAPDLHTLRGSSVPSLLLLHINWVTLFTIELYTNLLVPDLPGQEQRPPGPETDRQCHWGRQGMLRLQSLQTLGLKKVE